MTTHALLRPGAFGILVLLPLSVSAQEPILNDAPKAPNQIQGSVIVPLAIGSPGGSWIDTSSKNAVRYFYKNQFLITTNTASGWSGSITGCNAGTTSLTYQEAARSRFNWFRAMAGVPAGITFDAGNNSNDQQAALMMSANNTLNHTPPNTWTCYTTAGHDAAGQSNLCLGFSLTSDPGCLAGYVLDSGSNNAAAGHRRWVLHPQTRVSGTGDVTPTSSNSPANDLSAWDSNVFGPRPATRQNFVAWPPQGYVPYQHVYPRWSFGYANADFSAASVVVSRGGSGVSVSLETVQNGFGENTLVFNPNFTSPYPKPAADENISVTVNNVVIGGVAQNFSYQVIVFDPDSPSAAPVTATSVFRNSFGSIIWNAFASSTLVNGGGIFGSDPSVAQSFSGETYATARDNFGSVWANVYNPPASSWGTWSYGGGITVGKPAIAVATNGVAYVSVRDSFNSYWIVSYSASSGFGSWTYLAGIFSSDPVMAAAPDGSVYVIGKDTFNSIWSGRYVPGSSFQGWQYGAGIVKGKPSIAVGTDGVAYVGARDNFDSLWIGRAQGNTWLGWSYGAGVMSADPQVVAAGNGSIYAVVRDTTGGIWYRAYFEGTNGGWQSWTHTGGVLQDAAAGGAAGALYVTGRDANGDLWWYKSAGNQWTSIGNRGAAAGPLAAAPK